MSGPDPHTFYCDVYSFGVVLYELITSHSFLMLTITMYGCYNIFLSKMYEIHYLHKKLCYMVKCDVKCASVCTSTNNLQMCFDLTLNFF